MDENDYGNVYNITGVSVNDILEAFADSPKREEVEKAIEKMTEDDMIGLASKLADDYVNQLYWDSLRIIFENKILNR